MRIEAEQIHIDLQMEKIRDRIGVSTDGWTSNERYEDALKENEHVKAEALGGDWWWFARVGRGIERSIAGAF